MREIMLLTLASETLKSSYWKKLFQEIFPLLLYYTSFMKWKLFCSICNFLTSFYNQIIIFNDNYQQWNLIFWFLHFIRSRSLFHYIPKTFLVYESFGKRTYFWLMKIFSSYQWLFKSKALHSELLTELSSWFSSRNKFSRSGDDPDLRTELRKNPGMTQIWTLSCNYANDSIRTDALRRSWRKTKLELVKS